MKMESTKLAGTLESTKLAGTPAVSFGYHATFLCVVYGVWKTD